MKETVSQLVGVGDLVLYAIIAGGTIARGRFDRPLFSLAIPALLFIPTGIGILLKKKWGRVLAVIAGVIFFLIMLASLIAREQMGAEWGQIELFLILAVLHILAWRWLAVSPLPRVKIAAAAAPGEGPFEQPWRCLSCGSAAAEEEGIRFCQNCGAALVRKDLDADGEVPAKPPRREPDHPAEEKPDTAVDLAERTAEEQVWAPISGAEAKAEPEPDLRPRRDETAPKKSQRPNRSRKALLGAIGALLVVVAVLLVMLIRQSGKRTENETASVSTGGLSKLSVTGPAKESRVGGEEAKESAVTRMPFVWIHAGVFDMGSEEGGRDQKPVHRVTLDGFWMGKYEVSQGQWKAVMGDNPSYFKTGDESPVEMVSWKDAQEFIRRLNDKTGLDFRLPTEAEWEYACRAGESGDPEWDLSQFENRWIGPDGVTPNAGGSSRPNAFGLYEMWGNVREWCQDWYGNYPSANVRNPSGPASGTRRVIRSHDWGIDQEKKVRAADRDHAAPSEKDRTIGFRIVISE